MEKDEPEIYNCDDENLGQMLARLFAQGPEEVEIQHPTDGPVVVTRADFEKHLKGINKVINMSPAERIVANKRIANIKNAKQIKFRTAMIEAKVHTVDVEDDSSFGVDVDGNTLDIDGLVFVPVVQYLDGIIAVGQELGAFVDESGKRPPVRIKQQE